MLGANTTSPPDCTVAVTDESSPQQFAAILSARRRARLVLPAGTFESDKAAWLAARRESIGGSDASAVVGVNPYATPHEVWLCKTGRWPGPRETPQMRAGHRLEPVAADMFAEESGLRLAHAGTWRSRICPWESANPDRWTDDGHGLEIKTAFGFQAEPAWRGGPQNHAMVQSQWYMHVTGCQQWYIAVLINGWLLWWWTVHRDQDLIDMMVEAVARFWHDHVQADAPPPVDGSESTAEALRSVYGYAYATNRRVWVPGITELADRRLILKASIDETSALLTETENTIKAAMGDAQYAVDDDNRPVIAWTPRYEGKDTRYLRDVR